MKKEVYFPIRKTANTSSHSSLTVLSSASRNSSLSQIASAALLYHLHCFIGASVEAPLQGVQEEYDLQISYTQMYVMGTQVTHLSLNPKSLHAMNGSSSNYRNLSSSSRFTLSIRVLLSCTTYLDYNTVCCTSCP